jgi:hypothetical protein
MEATGARVQLVVRFMLICPDPKLTPRTTSPLFGGPIHAAVGNRQQRPDRWTKTQFAILFGDRVTV